MTGARVMQVVMFTLRRRTVTAELVAEPLEPMPEPGVVREAVLTTSIDSNGRSIA